MGEEADYLLDRTMQDAMDPERWRYVGRKPEYRHAHSQPTAFRDDHHTTSDGRNYRIHEMETTHLVNCVHLIERNYLDRHGFDHWNQRAVKEARTALYRSNPYHSMVLELAYRRFILNVPFECELYEEATFNIMAFSHDTRWKQRAKRGTDTQRYQVNQVNIANYPKETTMNNANMISLLQKDFYTIGVKFDGAQVYTYKVPNKVKLEVGDYVVTKSPAAGFGIAKVVRVDVVAQIDPHANYEYKWIVQKVERDAYDAQVKLESELKKELLQVETAHQRELLVDKMSKHLPEGSDASKLFASIREKAASLVIGTDYVKTEEKAAS